MRQYGRMTTGVLLIALGILALLGNIGISDLLGEALVAIIGCLFMAVYFVGKQPWAIYPGAFTLPVGIVILLAARGLDMDVWWPLFVAAPGVSFLIIRSAGTWNRWATWPGSFLVLIAGIMFAFSSGTISWLYIDVIGKLWPIALILLGLLLIVRSFGPRYPQGGQGPTEPR